MLNNISINLIIAKIALMYKNIARVQNCPEIFIVVFIAFAAFVVQHALL